MKCITIEVDPADVYLRDIAEHVVEGAGEVEMLESLAEENERFSRQSGDKKEKQQCLSCAAILREAATKIRGLP